MEILKLFGSDLFEIVNIEVKSEEEYWKVIYLNVCSVFRPVWLFVTLRTVALQVPLPMGIFRQEYCSGWPFSEKIGLTLISKAFTLRRWVHTKLLLSRLTLCGVM